jgi:small subunit ribosomal protein S6
MNNYELMFIVRPNLEDEATNLVSENMKKVLETQGAKVLEVVNMGRRELAYEVKKFNNGSYFLFKVEANASSVKEFDRVANINEDIIRHIVVKKEN